MDNYNGNPEEEISPLSLELLFSPGLFVIPSHEQKNRTPAQATPAAVAPAPAFFMECMPPVAALSPAAATMLERMGQFISGTLLPGIGKAEPGTEARYRVVFTATKEPFSMVQNETGIAVFLPDAESLASSQEGKLKAAEALKRWAATCAQDKERNAGQ